MPHGARLSYLNQFAVHSARRSALGGLLTEASWRWVFLINMPIGAAVLVCGPAVLPRPPAKDGPARIDAAGVLMLSGGCWGCRPRSGRESDLGMVVGHNHRLPGWRNGHAGRVRRPARPTTLIAVAVSSLPRPVSRLVPPWSRWPVRSARSSASPSLSPSSIPPTTPKTLTRSSTTAGGSPPPLRDSPPSPATPSSASTRVHHLDQPRRRDQSYRNPGTSVTNPTTTFVSVMRQSGVSADAAASKLALSP